MSVLCVIPARGNSKRISNKNIRILLGKPLIGYTIEAALESHLCDKVVVSTDDAKISKVASELGVEVIRRPAEIASETSAIEDALRHAVCYVEERDELSVDIVVLLQANVPVRRKGEIDQVIRRLKETEKASAVATGLVVDQRPEWMKTVEKSTGKIKPFLKSSNLYRKQDLPELVLLDGAVLAIRKQVLMETEGVKTVHGFLGDNVYVVVHETKYATEIDEEEEFKLAEYYLSRKH